MNKAKFNKWLKVILTTILLVVYALSIPVTTFAAAQKTTPTPTPTKGDMAVHVLDVGQGLSILVQSGGQNLIYDGGDSKTSSFVVSYLQKQGVKKIDYLISSHYDSDHLSGLIGCLNAFTVKNVICSDYVHDSQLYKSFISTCDTKKIKTKHPAVGKEFKFGTGKFIILAPSSINASDSNNNSVAIKLINGENSFIFTGDAEHSSESAMCSSNIDLSCDVLVPGHHGSATATSWDFLQATVPEFAIISCGAGNQYNHPDKDTMDKFQSMDIPVYRTDKQGTIIAVSNGTDISWNQAPCNDYSPGSSSDQGTVPDSSNTNVTTSTTPAPTTTPAVESPANSETVWISATGEKYHNKPNCGRMNPDNATQMTKSEAEAQGYEPCKKCY